MKSVGFRIAFWYALASLVTLGCFFSIGRYLVEQHIVHSLDLGIAAEQEQVRRRLGTDLEALTPAQVRERLLPFASVRFGIELYDPAGHVVYHSRNLGNVPIPGVPMEGSLVAGWLNRVFRSVRSSQGATNLPERSYNAIVGELGEMRIGEYTLGQLTLRVAVGKEQVRGLVAAYQEVFYILLALMVVVSSVIGYVLSRILLRPLRLIQATAAHIGSDNLSERIPISSVDDELSNLARLLNQMFERLESSFNQVHRFAAEASHELKTPLSLMRLQTEKMLLEGALSPAQEESLQIVVEEINRLNRFIEELLFLCRAEADAVTLEKKPQDPRAFLDGFLQDAQVLADSRGVKLAAERSGSGLVAFDPRWLRQVVLNLLSNALNYTPAGKGVAIASEFTPAAWRLSVQDEGPGVPPEQRERIFERFVRLDHSSQHDKGSGLGLAICRSIVNLHQGRIWAESGAGGRGLKVIMELPRADLDAAVGGSAAG